MKPSANFNRLMVPDMSTIVGQVPRLPRSVNRDSALSGNGPCIVTVHLCRVQSPSAGFLIRQCRRGQTILLIEQNAYRSLEVANYAYVLETGRMTLEGEASQLIDHPHVKKAYLGR